VTTHTVFNQSTPLADHNLFATDRALMDALANEGAGWAAPDLHAAGARLGSAETLELARQANQCPPQFKPFDRFGHRIDEIEFHPAWHAVMRLLIGLGAHADPWVQPKPGAHVARAAQYLMFAQVENGAQCPATMTFASIPVMQRMAAQVPAIAREWLPRILSRQYDGRSAPATAKQGLLLGMGMTEKQGGSDVRANTTRAEPVGPGHYGMEYRLTGHKWFFSAPQSDAHLVLAQTDADSSAGISCFFLPRFLPDGSRNAIRIQRLKDKVGNRSNASAEVEFEAATAWLVGEVGRGISTILEMGSHTRLDCAIGSAGQLRAVVSLALHHASERSAFGKLLAAQPLMQNVLADLAVESEAATALALRLASTCDGRGQDPLEEALCRLLTPAAKYWICKRATAAGPEAMEVLGGNGYVEEAPMARFYRELPLNSIWEGSGNVMCLDVLRALAKTPACTDALWQELDGVRGNDRVYDAFITRLGVDFMACMEDEAGARRFVERIALAVQGALLIRGAPPFVADAFCASRLGDGQWGRAFGCLPSGLDLVSIVQRAMPR
jgi:putative acyl-CoA dehydrogenase